MQDPGQSVDQGCLRDPITLVGLILESASGLRRHLDPGMEEDLGLTGHDFEIMIRLFRSPGDSLRMSDLAAQTGLSRSGLTRALDRLVDVGLCTRESCDRDRRGTYAVLTGEGHRRMDGAILQHERQIRELLSGALTADEEAELTRLLSVVRDRAHPDAALLSESSTAEP